MSGDYAYMSTQYKDGLPSQTWDKAIITWKYDLFPYTPQLTATEVHAMSCLTPFKFLCTTFIERYIPMQHTITASS